MLTEIAAMRRGLELAARLDRPRDPNPRVGCVLLDRAGNVVGEGWHRGSGHPHAEVEALRMAGLRARGGAVVVTLEPCTHVGRTGPCTTALVDAGVARVVFAATDPNPAAAGGAVRLRRAGLEVSGGLLADEAEELNRTWMFAMGHGRPWVSWKVAASLDGRCAAADGTSRWISSAPARIDVHRLRARVGAVVAGTGTVVTDDAQLAARDGVGEPLPYARQPLRVVVGRRTIPPGARVLDDAAETYRIETHDPEVVLSALRVRGVHHVLLEGGPTLAAAFLRAGLVDEVIAYLAPVVLGSGPAVVADLGVTTLAGALRPAITAVDLVGDGPETNVRVTARLPHPSTTDHQER